LQPTEQAGTVIPKVGIGVRLPIVADRSERRLRGIKARSRHAARATASAAIPAVA